MPKGASPLWSWVVGLGESMVLLTPSWLAGLFVYPLDEHTTIVEFEAAVSRRVVTVQIRDKAKIDDAYFEGCSLPGGRARDRSGEGIGDVLENVGKKRRRRGAGRWQRVPRHRGGSF